jgi:selenocysteine lyase/cysteine desulfurase
MLTEQLEGRIDKNRWLALADQVRSKVAALLDAKAEEIAFTKNTSEGLNIVGAAMEFAPGDEILIASPYEHPNNILPWMWFAQRNGAKLVDIKPGQNEKLEDVICAGLTDKTKIVSVTSVDFASGRRTVLQQLGEECGKRGIFLLVDSAQSSGIFAELPHKLGVSGWATATQKGLLGLYGLGVLYVQQEWAERLSPAFLARFSVEMADGHEAARPEDGWALRRGAGRFEVGNHNYIALAALNASLDLLAKIGRDEVERTATTAADRLRKGLCDLRIPFIQCPPENRSHIIAVGDVIGSGHDTADAAWVRALSDHLARASIAHSVRRGTLRLSTHAFISEAMTDTVLGHLSDWRSETRILGS